MLLQLVMWLLHAITINYYNVYLVCIFDELEPSGTHLSSLFAQLRLCNLMPLGGGWACRDMPKGCGCKDIGSCSMLGAAMRWAHSAIGTSDFFGFLQRLSGRL